MTSIHDGLGETLLGAEAAYAALPESISEITFRDAPSLSHRTPAGARRSSSADPSPVPSGRGPLLVAPHRHVTPDPRESSTE